TLPDPATLSKELIHVLESAVIEWAYQVKAVIVARISPKFASGQNPGPRAEVEFWQKKELNLQAIVDQLGSLPFRRVGMILEKLHNSYFDPYKQIYIDTASALTEANNNVKSIRKSQLVMLDYYTPYYLFGLMHLHFVLLSS
ncbi:MAG: hypothetical protein EZS28_043719, partial [Streblomastix strix]